MSRSLPAMIVKTYIHTNQKRMPLEFWTVVDLEVAGGRVQETHSSRGLVDL